MSKHLSSIAVVGIVSAALLAGGPASAQDDGVDRSPAEAVAKVAPEFVADAVQLESEDGAITASLDEGSVSLPESSTDPLEVEAADGTRFQISLPSTEGSVDAIISSDGSATYDHRDGSASVVLVNPDSSVRIASVLDGEDSPTQIDYTYGGLRLVQFDDGGVVGYDEDGVLAVTVAVPWALDANGVSVNTWYTVDGSTLTQHVAHRVDGIAYPVVADPVNYGGNFMYTQILHEAVSQGITIAVYPAAINFSHYTNDAIFANYAAIVPSNYEQQKYRDQLICHVWNVGRVKMPWNLDSWRPNVGYNATVLALCNP